jgi:hypothetical protein
MIVRSIMAIRCAILAGVFFMLSGVTAEAQPADSGPKLTSISVVISKLRKEALDGWRQDKQWPRTSADFAAEMNWTIPEDQIVPALSRRLDRNPTIDAYLKWQLLSFGPNLSQLSPDDFSRVFNMAPEPLDAPKPQVQRKGPQGGAAMMFFGRQVGYVADLDPVVGNGVVAYNPRMGVVSDGVGFGADAKVELLRAVERANQQLSSARALIKIANEPVLAYREALIERSPAEASLRLAVLMKDVRDRVAAGDESARGAGQRLVQEAPKLAEKEMDPAARAKLAEWAGTLARLRTPVVTSVGLDGMDFRYDHHFVELGPDEAKRLQGYINAAAPAAP